MWKSQIVYYSDAVQNHPSKAVNVKSLFMDL